jgi:small GTP-binding protein
MYDKKPIKLIVLGDGSVGKTSLTKRFVSGTFRENYKITLGVDFFVKNITLKERDIKLMIFDTGGQERFSKVRPLYYKGAQGALLVFDRTNQDSFYHLPKWLEEIEKYTENIPIVLVGNKSDLEGHLTVPNEEAESFAKSEDLKLLYGSAKTALNVQKAFYQLIEEIFKGKTRGSDKELASTVSKSVEQESDLIESSPLAEETEKSPETAIQQKESSITMSEEDYLSKITQKEITLLRNILNIQSVILIKKDSGVSIGAVNFERDIDPQLTSAFLTAISTFGEEFEQEKPDTSTQHFSQLEQKGFIYWIFDSNYIRVALLLDEAPTNDLKNIIWRFIAEFETKYEDDLIYFNGQSKIDESIDLLEKHLHIYYLSQLTINAEPLTEELRKKFTIAQIMYNEYQNNPKRSFKMQDFIEEAFRKAKTLNYNTILQQMIYFIDKGILVPKRNYLKQY